MTDTHPDPSSDEQAPIERLTRKVARYGEAVGPHQYVQASVADLRALLALAGRHSIASGEGVGVEPSLGSSQEKALLQRIDAALGGLEPLTGQSEDYIWRPANRAWEALVAAKNVLQGRTVDGDEE